MTHTKTVCAISNVRLPLLVGVSIAALSLSNGAALAQSVVANGGLPVGDNLQVSGTGDLIGSVSSTPVTGLTFYGSNTISIDGDNGLIVGATPADTTTITNGALTTGTGVISTFNGQTNLNGATTFGVGGTVGFNSGFTVSVGQNAWFGATTVIDGNGTIAVGATGQTTIDGASGSLTTAATTNLQGQTNFGATGQSFFDTNGNLQIGAAGAGVTLNTDGTASFGGAVTIGNAANGITLSPDGTSWTCPVFVERFGIGSV
jgi:fibronectin-binding autotransporter adhesin